MPSGSSERCTLGGYDSMNRPIIGFHLDEDSDWLAELACGHGQHVRHDPPFSERSWVLTEASRDEKLGTPLDCVRCDRSEMPEGYQPYGRTAEFTEETVPAALLEAHSTKRGVWGLIHVLHGQLEYTVDAPLETCEAITPGTPGVVLPELPHRVAPVGSVTFFVEFWRRQ